MQSGARWQTLGVAAGLGTGPQIQREPGLASEGVLQLCTLLSLVLLLPRPEPAGLLRLVIRREHHQHNLPQHQNQPVCNNSEKVHVSDLAYADDIVILSSSYSEMQGLLEAVNRHTAAVGMRMPVVYKSQERQRIMSENDTMLNTVQLMLSTDPSYDNRTIASTLKMQIQTVQRAQGDEKISAHGYGL